MVLKSSKAFVQDQTQLYALTQPGCNNILKAERKANILLRQQIILQDTLDKQAAKALLVKHLKMLEEPNFGDKDLAPKANLLFEGIKLELAESCLP